LRAEKDAEKGQKRSESKLHQAEEAPKSRGSNIFKSILFIAIFFAVFTSVTKVLTAPGDYRNYQWIRGFYEETSLHCWNWAAALTGT